jgi:hypothetical protein
MSLLHLLSSQFLKSICLSACPLALFLHWDILLGREYTSSEAPVSFQMRCFILYVARRRCCTRKLLAILFLSTLVPSQSPQFAAVLRTTAGGRFPFFWHWNMRPLKICKNVLQTIDSRSRRQYVPSEGWEPTALVSTSYPRIKTSATQLWELQNLDNLRQRLKAVRRCYLLRFKS